MAEAVAAGEQISEELTSAPHPLPKRLEELRLRDGEGDGGGDEEKIEDFSLHMLSADPSVLQQPLRQWATGRSMCFLIQKLININSPSPLTRGVEFPVALADLLFEFRIHHEPLVIEPNPPLVPVAAVEATTRHRPLLIH